MRKKKQLQWCKHFDYNEEYKHFWEKGSESWIDDNWKYCPYCGEKRPRNNKGEKK